VAAIVCFALGLVFWVGYTIATIQVEPSDEIESTEAPGSDNPSGHPRNASR